VRESCAELVSSVARLHLQELSRASSIAQGGSVGAGAGLVPGGWGGRQLLCALAQVQDLDSAPVHRAGSGGTAERGELEVAE